ncbi:hypothetical protein I317_07376 [Kwoniella heveanensis CBS 569]|uniref:Uncharacterized protein n=1 Tax=Kwoniella heveanensis BCC8398 TaxID=1296120 RepID=A0A1B9H1C1_9TREE|nr:hypothetical protein I316_00978 [Kwoniella heveanensis BCC8398]OCF38834.1 hypothetical protein I317_07376 [Kwoniella heveanensis CBS 569]
MSLRNVTDPKTRVSVSSTAQGSSKKHLLDPSTNDEEIPWSSNIPTWVHLTFPTPIKASHFAIEFQGGFVGTSAAVWVARSEDAEGGVGLGLMMGGKVYPEDKNKRQVFRIPLPTTGLATESELSSAAERDSDPHRPTIVTEITPAEANSASATELHPDGQGIAKTAVADGTGAGSGVSAGQPATIGTQRARKEREYPYLTELKIEFEKSSDQYGRVIVYSIEVLSDE